MAQAAGSWSVDTCCANPQNDCNRDDDYCIDHTSSSDWLFGLGPGPPQRFVTTGADTYYQQVNAGTWPEWGRTEGIENAWAGADLAIGWASGAPGELHGACDQGGTYEGTNGGICGGTENWGKTSVEVWYPL